MNENQSDAALTAVQAAVNGAGAELILPDPREEQRKAAVHHGITEYFAVCGERDQYKRLYESKCLEVAEQRIAIEQAREAERLHVAKICSDAIAEGKRAEIERDGLLREIDDLRDRLRDADNRVMVATAESGALRTFVRMVRAAMDKVDPPNK